MPKRSKPTTARCHLLTGFTWRARNILGLLALLFFFGCAQAAAGPAKCEKCGNERFEIGNFVMGQMGVSVFVIDHTRRWAKCVKCGHVQVVGVVIAE